jgi:hypothetical protein
LQSEKGGKGFKRLVLGTLVLCHELNETRGYCWWIHSHGEHQFVYSINCQREDLYNFVQCTLFFQLKGEKEVFEELTAAIEFLNEKGFLICNEQSLGVTKLGEATFHSSFSPEEALVVNRELQQDTIILSDELHLCMYCTTGVFLSYSKVTS